MEVNFFFIFILFNFGELVMFLFLEVNVIWFWVLLIKLENGEEWMERVIIKFINIRVIFI